MSYDVVVTETVGETSTETKFKNYEDYKDWIRESVVDSLDNTEEVSIKVTPSEEGEGRCLLTIENVWDEIKVGDTVVITEAGTLNIYDFNIGTEYNVTEIADVANRNNLAIYLARKESHSEWVDFSDPELVIYKIIK